MPFSHISFFAVWVAVWVGIGFVTNVDGFIGWCIYFTVMGAFISWFTYRFLPSNPMK